MINNERAIATDTSCLSMTSMFLSKMLPMMEHHRSRDRAIESWKNHTYRDPVAGITFVFTGTPDPRWEKIPPENA